MFSPQEENEYRRFQVALAPQVAYAYPPLIICPDAWLDADKALSLGFTIDAIKYSFGYYDFSERLDIANITAAKEEFTSAYEKQNFSSLDEYLKAIAVDIAVADTIDYYAKSTKPSSWCEACLEKSSLQKIFFNGGICYVVRMAPEDGMGARRTVGGRFFSAMLGDRTRGLLQVTSLWRLSVIRDTNATIKRPTSPPMYLSHSAWHYVTVASERYFMLKNGAVSCVNRDEIGPEYSTETCYAECTNKIYDRNFKCHWFKDEPVFTRTIHQHHGNYCNFYDLPATRYFDRIQAAMIQNQAIVKSPDHAVCVRKCPYECERVKFSLTAKAHIDEANLPVDQQAMCEKARSLNMTGFAVQMMNEDFYQGGVLTLTEVTTMTLPGLISSFGGALGLFVGGTMMTFVQIVLFVVRYLMDRASSKSVVQPTQATSDMVYSVSYF